MTGEPIDHAVLKILSKDVKLDTMPKSFMQL